MQQKIKKNKNKKLLILALVKFVLIIFLTNLFLENVRAGGIIEWMAVSFVFLFVSPFLVITKILHERPQDYFLTFKVSFKQIIYSLFITLFFVAAIVLFVVKLNWQDGLRVSSWVLAEDIRLMLFVNLLVVPVVVFAKEFFFRGFLMKRLLLNFGAVWAIFLQAVLFLIFELGVGGMISYKSMTILLLTNILLGLVAYKNRSILVSTVLHWVLLLILDIYFYYQFAS